MTLSFLKTLSRPLLISCVAACAIYSVAHAQNANAPQAGVDVPSSGVADLLSAGSFNAQAPWSSGEVNAASSALSQAANLVQSAQKAGYSDEAKKLNVQLPTAWEGRSILDKKQKQVISNFLLEGPGAPPPTCAVTGVTSPNTAKLTQANINEVMHGEKALTGMKKAISSSGAKFMSSRKITIDGVNALEVIIQPKMPKTAPDLTTQLVIAEQPGLRWQFACSAYTSEFETIKPEYDSVIKGISWVK